MTDLRKDLPPVNSPNFLEKLREAVQTYLGNRGDLLDRGLTVRDLYAAGLVDLSPNYLRSGGLGPPVTGPGPSIDGTYEPDLTPPPTPTGFYGSAGINTLFVGHGAPTYTQGHGHARTVLYGATWTSGAVPVFANAVPLGEFTGTVYAHSTNPGTTWHLWIKWQSVDGVLSVNPAGGTNGLVLTTGQDVELLLNVLAGQITASQLHADLSTRIDLIDGPDTLAGSVAARLLAEADARSAALLAEANTRTQALLDEADARTSALEGEALSRIEGIAAEAAARALAISTESSSREALATQFRGSYTGSDINAVTSGLFYQERITRASNDDALSQQITLLSAGSGEQFDYKNIWYFDTGVESWTGNGTPTASAGWIKPANHATDPYVESPTGINSDGNKYSQVRMRVRKTGAPVWGGYLWWRAAADSTWDAARRVAITEPTYDGLGIGVVVLHPGWSVVVDRIRVDLSDDQDVSNYFEADWVAIGRPSPGASSAQLLEEQLTRASADAAEVTARETLSSKLIGTTDPTGVTLPGLTSGILYDERSARTSADAAEVTARQTLATKITGLADPSGATLAGLTSGLLFDERSARSTAVGSEVTARETLATQLRGGYTGTDPNLLAAGLLYNEKLARVTADEAMASQITELSSVVDDTQAALATEELTRANADSALSSSITSLTATVTGNDSAQSAALQAEATTRANADSAESSARTLLAARVTATEGDISITSANLVTEQNTRASADTALASRATALESSVNSATTGLATKSSVTYVDQAKADAISSAAATTSQVNARLNDGGDIKTAIVQTQNTVSTKNANFMQATAPTATKVDDLWIDTTNGNVLKRWSGTAWVAADDQRIGSTASSLTTLQSTVTSNNNTLTSAIQQEATTRATQTGELYAQYTVKLDVNGYVSGFGLASTLTGATPYSQFIFKADQFAFGAPGLTTAYPFVIQASATYINGVYVPAGVYMDGVYIANGTITNVKIGNAAIDDAKIANLSASKLTIGDGTVGGNLKSVGFGYGATGWIIRQDGYAELNNVVVRGGVYASYGTFSGDIYASNGWFRGAVNTGSYQGYAWPTDGGGGAHLSASGLLVGNANLGKYFQITSDGNVYAPGFNIVNGAASFSGAVYASSGSFSGSVYASSGYFYGSVYASSGSFSGNVTAQTLSAQSMNVALRDVLETGTMTVALPIIGGGSWTESGYTPAAPNTVYRVLVNKFIATNTYDAYLLSGWRQQPFKVNVYPTGLGSYAGGDGNFNIVVDAEVYINRRYSPGGVSTVNDTRVFIYVKEIVFSNNTDFGWFQPPSIYNWSLSRT